MGAGTIVAIVVGASVVIAVVLESRRSRTEKAHKDLLVKSELTGMNEPATLHPVIDHDVCIGSGACVASCPEGTVLGIVGGRATLVAGSKCVGHGRCTVECPVDAIQLVLGTSKRGVDIPHTSAHHETNVPGLYAIGELGGMGLVRNAVRQGVAGTKNLAGQLGSGARGAAVTDVVIVGGGPAGVAAAITARQLGLSYRLLEREQKFGGAILQFPREKLVMTEPMDLPGYGPVKQREIPKEQLLAILAQAAHAGGIQTECGREVKRVRPEPGADGQRFVVELGSGEQIASRAVMLAIGRRGSPAKLGVPGEDLPKVAYKLLEPEVYRGKRILVVGGGNSAIEATLALGSEPGTTVTLSYRGQGFHRVAEKSRKQLAAEVAGGRIELVLESNLREIRPDAVVLGVQDQERSLPNDAVFIFAGGILPRDLLKEAGVVIERKFGHA